MPRAGCYGIDIPPAAPRTDELTFPIKDRQVRAVTRGKRGDVGLGVVPGFGSSLFGAVGIFRWPANPAADPESACTKGSVVRKRGYAPG